MTEDTVTQSPVVTIEEDGQTITLPESGGLEPTRCIALDAELFPLCIRLAIVEYLIERYGNGKLSLPASDKAGRAAYLQWLHAAEGTVQMHIIVSMYMGRVAFPSMNAEVKAIVKKAVKFSQDATVVRSPNSTSLNRSMP